MVERIEVKLFSSERSTNVPLSVSLNTELGSIGIVLSLDAAIAPITLNEIIKLNTENKSIPTIVANVILKKFFIRDSIKLKNKKLDTHRKRRSKVSYYFLNYQIYLLFFDNFLSKNNPKRITSTHFII